MGDWVKDKQIVQRHSSSSVKGEKETKQRVFQLRFDKTGNLIACCQVQRLNAHKSKLIYNAKTNLHIYFR